MSQKFSKNRREFLKSTLLFSLIILFNKIFAKKKIFKLDNYNQINNSIIGLRLWSSKLYTRIIFETNNDANIKYFELKNPHRLVIDFYNCKIKNSNNILPKNITSNIIDNIKVGQFSPIITRFVFNLKISINVKMQKLPPLNLYNINYKHRLIFDLYQQSINLSNQDMYQDDLLEIISNETKKNNNINKLNLSQNKINYKEKLLIVIDPGHGGEDPGAISTNGLKEKDVVLDIAKKLQKLINENKYMYSQLTRDKDIFIPLQDRVKFARKIHADMFISIHADAFTSHVPKGSSVFVLSEKGVSSNFAKWLAKNQNASDQIGGVLISSQNQSVRGILLDMSQTWTKRQSNKFATDLISSLSKEVELHSKYVEGADFVVLRAPDIPSILIETAFLSNYQDASNLAQEDFRNKIASIIYNTLQKFYNVY
jgi:N-acetylmuramoyl-L-alanine amidase